jgi:hypothetical protein
MFIDTICHCHAEIGVACYGGTVEPLRANSGIASGLRPNFSHSGHLGDFLTANAV